MAGFPFGSIVSTAARLPLKELGLGATPSRPTTLQRPLPTASGVARFDRREWGSIPLGLGMDGLGAHPDGDLFNDRTIPRDARP